MIAVSSTLALAASCCSTKRSSEPGGLPTLHDARAYELGTAGPRDYRKAAEIYASLCRDGVGDLSACHALLRATLEARGVARDAAVAGRLGLTMCGRGDSLGCGAVVAFRVDIEVSPAQINAAFARLETTEQECIGGQAEACEGALFIHGIGAANTAAGGAERYRVLADAACKLGVLDGCGVLAQDAANGVETNDRHQRAFAVLNRACDAGDATACEAIPGRELDPSLLCSAHAYEACAELGCHGDSDAARIAQEHGVIADCESRP
jgi:TPR repeat protein